MHYTARHPFIAFLVGISCVVALLAGCQTTAPVQEEPPQSGLTKEQLAVLLQAGFYETIDGWELGMSEKILFSFDKAVLTPEGEQNVMQLGQSLARVDIRFMRVEGHADNTGDSAYNEKLSLRRAQAVADALEKGGNFGAENLDVKGFGSSHPIASNDTPAGRSENRRVAIVVPVK